LSSLSLRERAKRFGYLPQGHLVHWPLQVKDVVALGRYPHGATDPARLSPGDEEAVMQAMQVTDVVALAPRWSRNCPAANVAASRWRGCWLSARHRTCDEPTASLDPRYQIDVMKNLRGIADSASW